MMSNARRNNSAAAAAALLLVLAGLGLSACSSMGDTLPQKAGGLPANAPARPADALPVPNVYEVRPTREADRKHTSELQSQFHLVCRLLLEKKKKQCIFLLTVTHVVIINTTYVA